MTAGCPNCGAPTPDGASFCEACGAKLGPADSGAGSQPRRRLAFVALALVVLGGLVTGAYFVGADTADDSGEIEELEDRLNTTEAERDEAIARAEVAETDASELSDEVDHLNERLDAELGLAGEDSAERDDVVSAADADLRLGEAGRVGDLLLRPTSFTNTGEGTEASIWVATITAKNDGSEPVNPFCGGAGAEVEDSQGRKFGGDSIIFNARNCGDDLQPGLSADNYKMRFKLPKDAEPVLLRLMEEFKESVNKTWAVG